MLDNFYAWLEATPVSQFMTGWQWAWPWAEAFHYIGLSVMFGCLIMMDARLMGFFRRHISLHQIHSLTPYALVAFLVNLITGIAFVTTRPRSYMDNPAFELKLVCMFLAGVNFLVFWFVVRKQMEAVADDGDTNVLAKTVGFSSLLLWTLVLWGGRMIPVYGLG
jgi:hypothetical protein